jgi:hypothetical protein
MAPVIPLRPMADGTLIGFFLNEQVLLTGKRLERVEAAHAALLSCIDAHAATLLPEADGRDLEADLSDEVGAISRRIPPPRLLDALPFFLAEERWFGEDLQDRRVRELLTWRLAQHVALRFDLRGSEPYEAVRAASWQCRKSIRRAAAEVTRRDLEARGVHIEIPQWLLDHAREREAANGGEQTRDPT